MRVVVLADNDPRPLHTWQGNAANIYEALRRAEQAALSEQQTPLERLFGPDPLANFQPRYWDDPSPSQNWKDGGAVT
jgi:hypothetical protein